MRITDMPARAPSRRTSTTATTDTIRSRRLGTSQAPLPDSATLPDVREALDALRHIVQGLRVGRAGGHRGGLSSAQLFALQQIGEHPDASVNDIAALTFTHQSSVSVVIQ